MGLKKYFIKIVLFLFLINFVSIDLVYTKLETPQQPLTETWGMDTQFNDPNQFYIIDYFFDNVFGFIAGVITTIALIMLIFAIYRRLISVNESDIQKTTKSIISIVAGIIFIILSYTIVNILVNFFN